jgi:hypothetical protein
MNIKHGDKTIKLVVYWWTDDMEGRINGNTGKPLDPFMAVWTSGTVNIKPNESRGIKARATGWTFNSIEELPGACMAALNWAGLTICASRADEKKKREYK